MQISGDGGDSEGRVESWGLDGKLSASLLPGVGCRLARVWPGVRRGEARGEPEGFY
jgi:hypothetical protein